VAADKLLLLAPLAHTKRWRKAKKSGGGGGNGPVADVLDGTSCSTLR